VHDIIAATVLMDTRPSVEAGRRHVNALAILQTHHDLPASFGWPHLDPESVGAKNLWLAQADRFAHDQIRSDGRFP
jgi:hypothetical protein